MAQHVKIVGILHIVLGCFGLLAAAILLAIFGGVAGIMSMSPDANGDLAFATPIVGFVGVAITLLVLVLSVPGIVIGIGLLRFRPWARVAGIVLSALDLIHVPFGTIVGAYGLWALLQPHTEALFQAGVVAPATPYGVQPPAR